MKAIMKNYFEQFAANINFPTIIYYLESGKVITYNTLATEILGNDIASTKKIISNKRLNIQELLNNQGSMILYNVPYRIRKMFYTEIDVEHNLFRIDDKYMIVSFFDYSYKQSFVRHMKSWLPRLAWKDNKYNFQMINASFLSDLKCVKDMTMPVATEAIVDTTTAERLINDDTYVINAKVPQMKMLQQMKSEGQEGYFCSINRIPLINSNGIVLGILESYRLIFEQKEMQQIQDAVLRSNSILSQLISKSDTVVLSWRRDESYHLEYASSNVSYYGYNTELLYRKEVRFRDIVRREDYKKIKELLEDIEHEKISYFEQDAVVYKANGDPVNVKINLAAIQRNEKESFFECLIQRKEEDIKEEKYNYRAGSFHLRLDSWANTKRREQLTRAVTDRCREFSVQYQPIVDIDTGSIIGVEALLRWNSPNLGDVKPLEFLSMSEYLGLMDRLGSFAIKEALKTYGQLQKRGIQNVKMHLNVSMMQLFQPKFVDLLAGLCEAKKIPENQIVLEVKEGLAIDDIHLMKKALLEIKKKGFLLALDNFGVGFVDMQTIIDLPFDYIKLDKKFMESYGTDKFNGALVVAMLDMIKSMKAEVVVEGVETLKQYEFLLFHEVKAYQGFYYSMPLEKKKLISLLQ